MKKTKLTALFLALIMVLTQFSFLNFGGTSIAASVTEPPEVVKEYFGKQLEPEARAFYDVMLEMYKNGMLEKGETYDLTDSGKVTQAQLQEYATGSQHLLLMMAAARDAFKTDYPDVFWVDFSAITLRVTLDTAGKYHAYLGAGRRVNYFLPGFTAENIPERIKTYESKISEIIQYVKDNVKNETTQTSGEEYKKGLAKVAHDYITKHMIYRYEYQVDNFGDESKEYSNARTAYDCFVFGEGVCESYTRGYKAILDRLGVPCIVVTGAYIVSETQTEEHAWNYVQIDGKWYAVDVTHDDPVIKIDGKVQTNKNSSKETREFLLVGETDINVHHIPSGIMSSAGYEFTYPTLEEGTIDGEEYYNAGKFKIRAFGKDYVEGAEHSGWEDEEPIPTTVVWVSYNDKNYTQNAAEGIYMLARFATYDSDSSTWNYTKWGYITPEVYSHEVLEGGTDPSKYKYNEKMGYYIEFPMPHLELIQFAVTNIAPKYANVQELLAGGLYYQGSPSLLTEKTPEIINENDIYEAPPHIKLATPSQRGKLTIGKSYDVTLEYDDVLVAKGGETPTVAIVEACRTDRINRPYAVENSKIENVEFNLEEGKVSFKFTPNDEFAANEMAYTIAIQGVVGQKSGKTPIAATYAVGAACDAFCMQSQGIDWNTYGQPELMDTSSMSTEGWEGFDMSDGSDADLSGIDLSKLSHRLSLVTTTTTPQESKDMLDEISKEMPDDKVINAQTYNIRLQLCKAQIVKTGQSIRVRVGFPDGTTYQDYLSGAREFKVYHYNYDPDTGAITGVETIPVEVTRQGLIIIVNSFSPFTIAAVQGDGTVPTEKKVILSTTEGGTITYTEKGSSVVKPGTDIIDMSDPNKVITVTAKADDGEIIKSLAYGGTVVPIGDNLEECTFEIRSSELEVGTTKVTATFMSKEIEEEDEKRHENDGVTEKPVEQPVMEYFMTEDADGSRYISRIDTKTTIGKILKSVDTPYSKVSMYESDGTTLITDENRTVGTGMILKIEHGDNTPEPDDNYTVEYAVVVHGDTSGDGLLKSEDIKQWIKNKIRVDKLSGAYLKACDYDDNGTVSSSDLAAIIRASLYSRK